MKTILRLLFILPILFLSLATKSQAYSFSVYQEDYVSLGIGFPLTEGVWDDPNYTLPIGFEFEFFDEVITNLESSDFFAGGILASDLSGNVSSVIRVYGPDIIDRGFLSGSSMSAIYFKTTGSPGQSVFTQEWYNVGFSSGEIVNDAYVDYIHFQVKLYEESGDIVFHFGPSSILHPELDYEGATGPSLGLLKNLDLLSGLSADEVILLTGSPLNPTVVTEISDVYLNGSIPENTVYRFSRNTTAVHEVNSLELKPFYFPNPCNQYVTLKPELREEIKSPVFVISATGQLVRSDNQPEKIELDGLPPGIYQLRFQTFTGQVTQRISLLR